MNRRFWSVLLITVLCIGMLSGCGRNQEDVLYGEIDGGGSITMPSGGVVDENTTAVVEEEGGQTTTATQTTTSQDGQNTTVTEQTTVSDTTSSTTETTTSSDQTVEDPSNEDTNITCLSFNVLLDGANYPPAAERQPHVVKIINDVSADIVGLQEAGRDSSRDWPGYIEKNMSSEYAYQPIDADADYTDGHMNGTGGLIILYKKERFEKLDSGAFKYSDNENQRRWFHWVKLKDKKTNKTVFVTNTHWSIDRDSTGAASAAAGDSHRSKQANELMNFWKKNVKNGDLLFATGDYNCKVGSKWGQMVSRNGFEESATVCGTASVTMAESKIDHCFVNTNSVEVWDAQMLSVDYTVGGTTKKCSDHQPYLIEVSYK